MEQDNLGSFGRWLGLEIMEATGDRVVLAWDVRPELWQPDEIVHGGVHCAVVESAASLAAALWLGDRGKVVGVSMAKTRVNVSGAGMPWGNSRKVRKKASFTFPHSTSSTKSSRRL